MITPRCPLYSAELTDTFVDLDMSPPLAGHAGFAAEVAAARSDLVEFMLTRSREGARIAGYGAPGMGKHPAQPRRYPIRPVVVHRRPQLVQHGKYLQRTHIPIHPVEGLAEERPDHVLILPWNLKEEISMQLTNVREWGGRLVVPLPELEVF